MTPRDWLAWKLHRLADRIHNTDSYTVVDVDGGKLLVAENNYGYGITMSLGVNPHNLHEYDTFDDALEGMGP